MTAKIKTYAPTIEVPYHELRLVVSVETGQDVTIKTGDRYSLSVGGSRVFEDDSVSTTVESASCSTHGVIRKWSLTLSLRGPHG